MSNMKKYAALYMTIKPKYSARLFAASFCVVLGCDVSDFLNDKKNRFNRYLSYYFFCPKYTRTYSSSTTMDMPPPTLITTVLEPPTLLLSVSMSLS
ncbi:hypothetical protein TNCV_1142221 [Trichonephila clavipes]|nr:hypothetical protein TNCV_1142221 [Trichonephila clavipes]